MSQENVEVVRQALDAFNRAFEGHTAEALRLLHEDVEWHTSEALPDPAILHGHDGALAFIEQMHGVWEKACLRPDEVLDLGEERVLAVATWVVRGKGSGVDGTATEATVFWLRAGRISRLRAFSDKRRALESLGLEE